MKKTILLSILLAFLPISELRGAIPYAYLNGVTLPWAFVLGVCANALVPVFAMVFLNTLHKLFYKISLYKKFFDKIIINARSKVEPKVKKYGYWGLLLFVAIPLPITGAWTGTVAAWVLGMDKKKSCVFVALGVVIAGLIVSAVLLSGAGISSLFIKDVTI